MQPVDPRIDPKLVPPGSVATLIAKDQPEYLPLPSVRTPLAHVITRWELTPEERTAIANGADLFITLLSNGTICPMLPTVGPTDWTQDWRG